MNTEVQLSNMELRTVSQFDTKARLGVPRRKSGGIPVLRDIPVLEQIPLIGWFSLRTVQAAVSQHTLIFAQATIYPTISSITNLLSSVQEGSPGQSW